MRISPLRTEVAKMRKASGLSQKEAADKLGISNSYLQKVELGKLPPSRRIEREIGQLGK